LNLYLNLAPLPRYSAIGGQPWTIKRSNALPIWHNRWA